jgi:hypothetical protein
VVELDGDAPVRRVDRGEPPVIELDDPVPPAEAKERRETE